MSAKTFRKDMKAGVCMECKNGIEKSEKRTLIYGDKKGRLPLGLG